MNLDAARSGREGAKPHGVLDDGVDVDRNVARVGLAREEEEIANHPNRPIGFALDQTHRLELLTLQIVLEEELREGRDAGERIVQLVRDAGDELADGGELFGPTEVVGDLSLLGEISDADHESDDVVAPVANVAQRYGSRELGPIFSPMDVLAGPELHVLRDRGNRLAGRGLSRGNDEIVDGQAGDLICVVAILLDRGGVGVLNLRIDAKYQHGLIHGRQRRGECSLARVGSMLVFAEEQYVDRKRDRWPRDATTHRRAGRSATARSGTLRQELRVDDCSR